MKKTIIKVLKETVAIPSLTSSLKENELSAYLYNYLSQIKYFKDNNDYFGQFELTNDHLKRKVIYGLVKGKTNKTIVLLNHYDVVGVTDFGNIQEYAFDIDVISDKLKEMSISEEARKDLCSDEWIFGRGTCDMKGGLAIQIAYLQEYSEKINKAGNILFISVPDEESYSEGMRGTVKLLSELKQKHKLDYRLMINSEPNRKIEGEQVISYGTAGKCLPVVLVQGKKAHIASCFEGLNPIGLLTEIFSDTELSLDFSDEIDGEVTVPPTWNYLKDMKNEYDVSIPMRACGYFSVISFYRSPDEILEKIIHIAGKAFKRYIRKMNLIYSEYRKIYKYASAEQIDYQPIVITFEKLIELAKNKGKNDFTKFYEKIYHDISQLLEMNEINYPQATITIMNEVLNYSEINYPVIIVGFSPPYYPALNSKNLLKESEFSGYCQAIKQHLKTNFGLDIIFENYSVALSDCSYCGVDKIFNYQKFAKNTPIWGDLYSIDFNGMENLNIPFFILGPWGKDLHQMTERVNMKSLTEIIPSTLNLLVNNIFNE